MLREWADAGLLVGPFFAEGMGWAVRKLKLLQALNAVDSTGTDSLSFALRTVTA